MLLPKRVKYRKQMRGRMTGKASRGTVVNRERAPLLKKPWNCTGAAFRPTS